MTGTGAKFMSLWKTVKASFIDPQDKDYSRKRSVS